MLMQNFGGQTKSIMVFSEVAYRKTLLFWLVCAPQEPRLPKLSIKVVIFSINAPVVHSYGDVGKISVTEDKHG